MLGRIAPRPLTQSALPMYVRPSISRVLVSSMAGIGTRTHRPITLPVPWRPCQQRRGTETLDVSDQLSIFIVDGKVQHEGAVMFSRTRFDCPSDSLASDVLLNRTRHALRIAFAVALTIHGVFAQLGGFRAEERPAKPLTTHFIKRQPRLTKPLT